MEKEGNHSSLSETTKKVFLAATAAGSKSSKNIKWFIKSPSTVISFKGLYPPNIPTKSLSVPIKLLTMSEHNDTLMKKSTSLPISTPIETSTTTLKKKTIKKKKKQKDNDEDEPMTKPLSLTEKRKRQAKRADQVKIWKVREEREAREARLIIRRQIVNGTAKKTTTNEQSTTIRKKKKRVKFNFDKNSIITIEYENDE